MRKLKESNSQTQRGAQPFPGAGGCRDGEVVVKGQKVKLYYLCIRPGEL